MILARSCAQELPMREAHQYPPVAAMVRLVVRGKQQEHTKMFAENLGDRLRRAIEKQLSGETPEIRVLGPAPAPFAKLRDQHRYHLQLHGPDGERCGQLSAARPKTWRKSEGIQWTADVDPLEMM